ncbi:MAG TPA: hypothetical protein VFH17_01535 [Coriobacteriia bacterium]|nr:hypothetical protein [Coriobacteriia bacterium]
MTRDAARAAAIAHWQPLIDAVSESAASWETVARERIDAIDRRAEVAHAREVAAGWQQIYRERYEAALAESGALSNLREAAELRALEAERRAQLAERLAAIDRHYEALDQRAAADAVLAVAPAEVVAIVVQPAPEVI